VNFDRPDDRRNPEELDLRVAVKTAAVVQPPIYLQTDPLPALRLNFVPIGICAGFGDAQASKRGCPDR
jgi:hypothetical protein